MRSAITVVWPTLTWNLDLLHTCSTPRAVHPGQYTQGGAALRIRAERQAFKATSFCCLLPQGLREA